MARIRTIKPEFFTSEDIVSRSPMARLLYIALWCEADKEGRLVWKPATFKLRYLPGDTCSVQELCDELVAAGLVILYGEGLAFIPTFKSHQHVNPRESDSQLPSPPASTTRGARVPTRHSRVSDAQGGKEGKGKERKGTHDAHDASGFDEFWEAWPKSERKQDKAKCAEKWKAHDLKAVLPQILADIEVKKRTEKWRGGFIEAPEVYLNNRRWEDGVTPGSEDLSAASLWTETRSGIVAKGIALGCGQWDEYAASVGQGEPFSRYKARVFKAAGVEELAA